MTPEPPKRRPVRARLSAPAAWFVYQAAFGAGFTMFAVLSSIYRIVTAGLDPLQLVLVGSALEAAALLFEVPTGVVADLVSRKLSVIIGLVVIGAGFVLEGSYPSFGPILAAQVVWGIGFTFTSGADAAWIADEVGEKRAAGLYVRGAQSDQAGQLVGGAVGVALGTVSLHLPLVTAGVFLVALAAFLWIAMPEDGFTRPERGGKRHVRRSTGATLRRATDNFRARPILWLILAVAVFQGASSEGFDRLSELHVLRGTGFPASETDIATLAIVFGAIYGVSLLLSMAATEFVRRRLDVAVHRSLTRALSAINALLVVSVVLFGLTGNFAAAVALLLASGVLREVQAPLARAWVNQDLDPRSRATVNSIASQSDALGQILGGPVLGAIALGRSVRAALVASGLLLVPAQALYARALSRRHDGTDRPGIETDSGDLDPSGRPGHDDGRA